MCMWAGYFLIGVAVGMLITVVTLLTGVYYGYRIERREDDV